MLSGKDMPHQINFVKTLHDDDEASRSHVIEASGHGDVPPREDIIALGVALGLGDVVGVVDDNDVPASPVRAPSTDVASR